MKLATLRKLLLSHPGAVEDHPFGAEPHVYKVGGRMFALVSADPRLTITLKLEPLHGQLLRDAGENRNAVLLTCHGAAETGQHPSVRPGYHMNKEHWNTITIDRHVLDEELADWIDESYRLVIAGLPRVRRQALGLGI